MKTYQYLWRLIRYLPGLYLLNALIWGMIHLSPLIPGLIAKEFFDWLGGKSTLQSGLWGIVVLLIVSALVRILLIFCGARVDIYHRFHMSGLLRRNLLELILHQPGARAIPCSMGEAVSRFRDDGDQLEDVISWTLDIIGQILFAGVAIWILMRINTTITLCVFTPLVLVVLAARLASKKVEHYRRASREATSQVTGLIGELFGAVQAVQLAAAEDSVLSQLTHLNDQRRYWMLRDTVLSRMLNAVFSNTVSLGTGLILLLAVQSMRMGSFGIGDFALFVYYLTFVTDFTLFFGGFMTFYQQTGVALERLVGLVPGVPPDSIIEHHPLYVRGELPDTDPLDYTILPALQTLEVCHLSLSYPDTGNGIKDISFQIEAGSCTVVTGQIGSGKSTLLRTLLGLLPRDDGVVRWNGQTVPDPASVFIPPNCAYTAQVPLLFSASVRENILLGLAEEKADLPAAIAASVLEQDLAGFEQGLDTQIGPRGVRLSGGQVQRVATARMLIRQPQLLVFDDISSALDVQTEQTLWERIFAQHSATYLVVSNRRAVLQAADQIIVLQDGCVVGVGPLEELLSTCKEMQRIWRL